MNENNKRYLNDVKNRFLPLPRNAVEEYEPEPNLSDFEIIKEVGVGSFGKVYLVSHKKTRHKFALKTIDKLDEVNFEEKSYFSREIEIMYKLNHPNICKLFSHFEDDNYCYFLLQYIPNGNAFSLIPKDGKKQQNMKLIASVMKDVISAIYYLHNMKPIIVHRDIKPENILLDENSKAYLTDFGWSNYIKNHRIRNTVCGTPLYLPPEMVSETGHNEKADIWCIGVLLFELSTGKVPFEGNDYSTVKSNISHLNISWPSDIDPDVKDLVSKILRKNPNERLSIEKILSHSFFTKYFPNAVKELIKPREQPHKVFIVNIDDPNTWSPIKARVNSTRIPSKAINKNITKSINADNILINPTNSNNNLDDIKRTQTMLYNANLESSLIKENNSNNSNNKNFRINNNQNPISKVNNNNRVNFFNSKTSNINDINNNYRNLNQNNQINNTSNYNFRTIEVKITKDLAQNNNISTMNKNENDNSNKKYDSNKQIRLKVNTNYLNNNNSKNNNSNNNTNNNTNNYYLATSNNNNKTISSTSTVTSTTEGNYISSANCHRNKIKISSPDNKKELDNKYSELSKKYDSLKKEYDNWKNNEIEKLRKELREKENTLSQLMHQHKSCEFPENENNFKKLESLYEVLKFENNELKAKIRNYPKYLKDKKKNEIDSNNNRRSLDNSNIKFPNNNLDSKTQKNIDAIIKDKDKQISKYKEELRIKREKEKERFVMLINRYDRTLIVQEKENEDLKSKLRELERQLY
jgi:serine/threonine protein kinase